MILVLLKKTDVLLITKKGEIHVYNTRYCSLLHFAIGQSKATYNRIFSFNIMLI